MRFREHRGSLEDSLKTLREFENGEDLIVHISNVLFPWNVRVDEHTVHAQLYDTRPDTRIGWPETWIITIDGYGVMGMTDRDPKFPPPRPVHEMGPVRGS